MVQHGERRLHVGAVKLGGAFGEGVEFGIHVERPVGDAVMLVAKVVGAHVPHGHGPVEGHDAGSGLVEVVGGHVQSGHRLEELCLEVKVAAIVAPAVRRG